MAQQRTNTLSSNPVASPIRSFAAPGSNTHINTNGNDVQQAMEEGGISSSTSSSSATTNTTSTSGTTTSTSTTATSNGHHTLSNGNALPLYSPTLKDRNQQYFHSNGIEELSEKGKPRRASLTNRPLASSGNTASDNEWRDLRLRLEAIARQWKRIWDKEGFAGLANKWKHTSLPTMRSSHLQPYISRIPPRRRALIVITSSLILFVLYSCRSPSSSKSPAAKSHLILSGSGVEGAIVDRTTGLHRGHNKARVVESFSNPYGFMNLIDPYAGGVFNPSVLVLPDTVGEDRRFLFVARGPEKYEVIQEEDTRWQNVYGCHLIIMHRAHLKLPYLARETQLETLKLPAKRKVEYLRCHDPVYDQFIGAEDPRLFLTNDGQPLLIYSQTGRSPNICRAIYIIDARVVIPGLSATLKKGGWNPPVVFTEQTDLIRENQFNIEKNWAPFLGEKDELHFHVSLVPQEVYKFIPGMTLRAMDPNPPRHNCLTQVVNAQMNRVKFHHATPLLRATLCRRGECVPDVHNTVLFGIVHIKYHPEPYLFYERRVVTWNVTAPYNYLSVSKPLTYSGTNQADPIFTVSIAWDHPTQRYGLGLNHGFLDDVVITSFGVGDYGSAYIDVLARDFLTDHDMCTGFEKRSLFGL